MKAYIVQHKQDAIVAESRSGGIFTALSDIVLNKNGVIYGVRWDEQFVAIHCSAESNKERDRFRKSKYVQSKIDGIFEDVLMQLNNDRYVLFSGTSCQVAGLLNYLRLKKVCADKLTTVDILCHGVPSPKVWADYLAYQEKKHGQKITAVDSGDKRKFGWAAHMETIWVGGGDKEVSSKIFRCLYYEHNILRPSCYHCPYKEKKHPADITIGDAWGVQKNDPDRFDDRGISLVILNNDAKASFLNEALEECAATPVSIEDYMQPALVAPYREPWTRKAFWAYYAKSSFQKIIDRYVYPTLFWKIYRKIDRILHNNRLPFMELYSEAESIDVQKRMEHQEARKKPVGDKLECCGCSGCASICPKNAITMVQDIEGFYYPHVEERKCIDCGLCDTVCALKQDQKKRWSK